MLERYVGERTACRLSEGDMCHAYWNEEVTKREMESGLRGRF